MKNGVQLASTTGILDVAPQQAQPTKAVNHESGTGEVRLKTGDGCARKPLANTNCDTHLKKEDQLSDVAATAGDYSSATKGQDADSGTGGEVRTPVLSSPRTSTTYHTARGGNSNGLHVTQGSAPESDRHPALALSLDGPQERNGCVAQMDMPLKHAAPTADESRASAETFPTDERFADNIYRALDAGVRKQ